MDHVFDAILPVFGILAIGYLAARFGFERRDGTLVVEATGRSAHSGSPGNGTNAITHLAELLSTMKRWFPLVQRDIPAFEAHEYGDKPDMPDDLLEDAGRMFDMVEDHGDAHGPLPYEDEFFTISASPNGDKVTVCPYDGDFGELVVSADGGDSEGRGLAVLL